jgi:hypothetical protein
MEFVRIECQNSGHGSAQIDKNKLVKKPPPVMDNEAGKG